MKNLRNHLQLVVNNPNPIKKECTHGSISVFAESSTSDAYSYMCDYCKTKFGNQQIGIFQDAFGYTGYHAITD